MNNTDTTVAEEPPKKPQKSGMEYQIPMLEGADRKLGARALWRMAQMALQYKFRFPMAIIAVIAAGIFQLLIPRFLGEAVDHATGLLGGGVATEAEAKAALITAAALLISASVLRGLFTMAHNYQGEAVGQCIGYRLKLAYFEKLQRLSFGYHDKIHSGDLMTRGMLDIDGIRRFVEHGIIRVILFVVLVGGGSWMYMSADLTMGLLCLSFVPFAVWRASVYRLNLRRLWRELQERMSILTRIMEENLGGIRVVRSFMAQKFEMGKFEKASQEALDLAMERVQVRYSNTSITTFSYFIAMGLVLWVGGLKVIDGTLTVGELTTFLAFMTILQMPIRQIGMIINGVARASVAGVRLFDILDREPEIKDAPDAKALKITKGVLKFENVSFAYEGFKDATVSDISFEVGPGQTLGVVGPPGSGKSTVAHLIPRFYDVTDGSITIDGQDIREVTLDSLRDAVGVVQQDTFLFTTEIGNNVAYGEPDAEPEIIRGATDSAQLHNYIETLPEGYDTLVGERGVSLSGGQRQRLSIARSVLLTPSIMVFDDSTAAIDAATEQRIRAALRDVTKERAVIIISHRLSSLMHADEIVFLEGGRIVERGTHDELVQLGGRYRALYDLQLGSAAVAAE